MSSSFDNMVVLILRIQINQAWPNYALRMLEFKWENIVKKEKKKKSTYALIKKQYPKF